MDPEQVEANIRIPSDHIPRTSLICLENTHNNWSGSVVSLNNFQALREVADRNHIKIHLDGARIFNASHASGVPVKQYADMVDSLMFCLSKGLSAPVGSLLVGSREFVAYGRRIRKALGGGMRQVGVIAAAGIIALSEMTERLPDDHKRAKELAKQISPLPGVTLDPDTIETNIIIFGFDHPKISIPDFLIALREKGILAMPTKGGIRFVTHKDVDDGDVKRAVKAFQELLS
jgi:threonine aldolase